MPMLLEFSMVHLYLPSKWQIGGTCWLLHGGLQPSVANRRSLHFSSFVLVSCGIAFKGLDTDGLWVLFCRFR
ncbi:hypothetical protein Nepgr_031519 [Nepenthes gracilis]|uniref:Uncharacterized protein n=1 Tax=Nepenthes gracilis TaxID=150966 RepID=A0AAD3TIN7_NEPGR|nr:hypothetical protein Nepgr_031519 [Nepenthes gracilis]